MTSFQFEAIGGDWIDPPLLIPAALPLELSGESIRSRLITSSDTPGEELALRPDLTLPVANHYLAEAGGEPVSYRYFGRAFRQARTEGEPVEFNQTGFENFGHTDRLERDVATLTAICSEIADAGIRNAQLNLGDVSIFHAVVDALALSDHWDARIRRANKRREGVEAVLASAEGQTVKASSALAQTLAKLPADDARDLLDEVMSISGTEVVGGRTKEEILERLQARAEAANAGAMPDKARAVLGALKGVSGTPDIFLKKLRALASEYALNLSSVLEYTDTLFSALSDRDMPFWANAHVSVQFGRRFDYYDGLVFELYHAGLTREKPLALGGRYDGLVSWLSKGAKDVPAVGGVVRPDRVEAALNLEGGEA